MSIEERIYSEAFEEGVDYAIEKMFAEEVNNLPAVIPGKEPAAASKEGLLKRIWKSKLGKAGIIGTGVAGLGYGGYKLYKSRKAKKEAEAEAEKNYSEGFEDGIDYAVQKLYVNAHQAKQEERDSKNWRGLGAAALLPGASGIPGYLVGRSEVKKAIREGKSDEDVKAAGRKVSNITGGIEQGVLGTAGAVGGAILGKGIGAAKAAKLEAEAPAKLKEKIAEAYRHGKSDKQVEKIGDKFQKQLARKVKFAKSGIPGALIGGGIGFGLGTVGKKIDQLAIDRNADEAIRRRKMVREERAADFR